MKNYLTLTNISKHFEEDFSLSSISVSLAKGEVLGILGPSGCGKTTLLKLILGLITPSEGDIRIEGRSILSISPEKRNFGYIPQNLALFSHLSVAENITFGMSARKVDVEIRENRLSSILTLLNLTHLGEKFPHEISGGERQRTALGRALALEPALILMDEPLSSLDTKLSQKLKWQIKKILRTTESTVIFVTHNPGEAISICDRIAVMDNGSILQIDKADELLRNPKDPKILEILGKTNIFPIHKKKTDSSQTVILTTSIGSFPSLQNSSSDKLNACWIAESDILLEPSSNQDLIKISAILLGTVWGRVRNRLIFQLPDDTQLVVQVPISISSLPQPGENRTLYLHANSLKWI